MQPLPWLTCNYWEVKQCEKTKVGSVQLYLLEWTFSPHKLFVFLEFWSPYSSVPNLIGCVEPCISTQFRVLLIRWKSKLIAFYLDYVVGCDGSRLVCLEGLPRDFIFRTHQDFSSSQYWKSSKWSYICNTLFVKSIKTKIIIKALFHLFYLCLWVLLFSHCILLPWKMIWNMNAKTMKLEKMTMGRNEIPWKSLPTRSNFLIPLFDGKHVKGIIFKERDGEANARI